MQSKRHKQSMDKKHKGFMKQPILVYPSADNGDAFIDVRVIKEGEMYKTGVIFNMYKQVSEFYKEVAKTTGIKLGSFRLLMGDKDFMPNEYGHRPLADYAAEMEFNKYVKLVPKMMGGGKRARRVRRKR